MTTLAITATRSTNPRPVAPYWHMGILLAVLALITIGGSVFQHQGGTGSDSSHPSRIPLYLSLIAAEWGLFRFAVKGSGMSGTTLAQLIGFNWKQIRGLPLDFLLGVALWGAWELLEMTWANLFGAGNAASIQSLLPRAPIEIALWIAVSISAGICEEVAFRGYCQRQFAALTRSRWLGLLLQALVFGVAHGYQGYQSCIRIVLYGVSLGLLAFWRKSLRPGMLGHACADIVAGVFGF